MSRKARTEPVYAAPEPPPPTLYESLGGSRAIAATRIRIEMDGNHEAIIMLPQTQNGIDRIVVRQRAGIGYDVTFQRIQRILRDYLIEIATAQPGTGRELRQCISDATGVYISL